MAGRGVEMTAPAGAWRMGVAMVLIVAIAACAPRPVARVAPPDPAARIEPVYIAAQRRLDGVPELGAQRSEDLKFLRADVSIPPVHRTGRIEWPDAGAAADTARHFAMTDLRAYPDAPAFARALQKARAGSETMVYVHGFNVTISEAIYRLAQIRADFRPSMPSVLFSWPSAGDPRGYIYDRDSVLFARDKLAGTLRTLTNGPDGKVFLLAHSMGAQLVMEVLRQAAIGGDRQLLSRVSGVVLMSPDIDPDVFREQAEAIGELPQPFMIFIARQDRALSLAGFLSGRKPRLGVIDSPGKVAGLDVQVFDFSALADGEGYDHFVPVTSPAAISVLRGLIAQAGKPGPNGFGEYMVLEAPL